MTNNLDKLLIFNDDIKYFIANKIKESYSFASMGHVNNSLELLDNFCESDCLAGFNIIFDLI